MAKECCSWCFQTQVMRTIVHGRSDWHRFLELYSINYKELQHCFHHGLSRWHNGKESARDARDMGSIPGSEDSPGEENSNTPHYSCLGNFIDRRVWRATIHGITRSWTWLSDGAYYHHGGSVMDCHTVITLLVHTAGGSKNLTLIFVLLFPLWPLHLRMSTALDKRPKKG